MARPLVAEISHSALVQNFSVVRQHVPFARIWAVIKANAYGHGALRVARVLEKTDGFALLEMATAIALREDHERRPILLLEGVFSEEEWKLCAKYDLQAVVHNHQQVQWLERVRLAQPVTVHVKLNTGMQRLGFRPNEAAALHLRLQGHKNVVNVHWLTHFANADEEETVSDDDGSENPRLPVSLTQQMSRFETALIGLPGNRSLANSAAILRHPQTHADWVRPGIMLYGATPFAKRSAQACELRAVMTLRSEIISVQHLQPGDAVGYGSRFRAERPMQIGVVACGYADGYPRHAPDGTPVAVEGIPSRLVGRVSMDMLMVDLSPIPYPSVGMPVELWGVQVPIDEVAQAVGTVGYELMCAVAPRVPVVDVD